MLLLIFLTIYLCLLHPYVGDRRTNNGGCVVILILITGGELLGIYQRGFLNALFKLYRIGDPNIAAAEIALLQLDRRIFYLFTGVVNMDLDIIGTVICCTRYGNVMCSRGSVIPLFIDQIRAGNPITITNPAMTRFLMNLDEAVDLVRFAFEHANPGDLFIQKADASTIGDLAKGVQRLFGDTGTRIIGTRHGEKLYETLMTREERIRSEDMGRYFRVAADNRDLNYDKFFVQGQVVTEAEESYTSHNTRLLDVDGVVEKILTTEYVREALRAR